MGETRLTIPRRPSSLYQAPSGPPQRDSGAIVIGPDPRTASSDSRDNLVELLQFILHHKGILTLASILGLIAGVGLVMRQASTYEARTSIELQGVNEDFLDMRRVDPTAGNYGADTYVQTQIKLLQSDSLRDSVVAILGDSKGGSNPAKADKLVSARTTLPGLRALLGMDTTYPASEREALRLAAESVKIRGAGLTRMVEVYSQSTLPDLAAKFTNTLADQFIQQNLQDRLRTAQETTHWLSGQLDDLRTKLERAERNFQATAQGSMMTVTAGQENLGEAKLKQIQVDLVGAQADRVAKQSVQELATERAADDLSDVLGDPTLRDYKVRITELSRQIADRMAVFTAQHPEVLRLKSQLQTLQSARDREVAQVLRRIDTDYQTAKRRETLLEGTYAKQSELVSQQTDKAIQYNLAKRELDANRTLYDTMLQKVREAGMAAAMRRSEARVIDYAKPPKKAASPQVAVTLALSMFAGFGGGLGLLTIRKRLTRRFEEPGDSALLLGLPELGVIPSLRADPMLSPRTLRARIKIPTITDGGKAPAEKPPELSFWDGGPCVTSESYHGALVSINFAANGDLNRRVLMLTSSDPGEGKTFNAVSLSVAASKRGLHVLLIDGDMRRPRVHSIFSLPRNPGLSDLLSIPEGVPTPEMISKHVRETCIDGLSVLSSGEPDRDIACLLHSPKLPAIIDWARDRYDLVFVDTPPVLQVSDARVIGRQVDAVVFTVRAQHTVHFKAQEALRKFEQDGTVVLGTMLSDWTPSQARGGTAYYRNHTSYYPTVKS